jgi:FkbM family methyltransferase
VDVGANIGSYTVLAGGVAQASVVALEPSPATFGDLLDNIGLNRLQHLVRPFNMALGEQRGHLRFTVGLDTVNHVLSPDETTDAVTVDVCTLDDLLAEFLSGLADPAISGPTVVKIDVEGFETQVIRGAARTLRNDSLLAVLMEFNGSGTRYGYDEKVLHQFMLDQGFTVAAYDPMTRDLQAGLPRDSNNFIYIRNQPELQRRLRAAPKHSVNGVEF